MKNNMNDNCLTEGIDYQKEFNRLVLEKYELQERVEALLKVIEILIKQGENK